MDPPPLPPQPTTTTTPNVATSIHLNYPDSVESSPHSHTTETINDHLPPVPGAKLRLMCSYGGHIMPRPHDKVLCYVGGDTRMVVVDRQSALSSLTTRLSRRLLNGRSFTLKYQLPNEDLDSLVSITTDEDLDNMIEEYDRITSASNSPSSSCRIRLFLFFNKPETAASMGALLDDAKSETWFVDALNGSGLIPRNLSDSATVDCLLNFDDGEVIEELKAQGEKNKQVEQSSSVMPVMADPPLVENSLTSLSPSMANLPPIRVRMEDQKVGVDDQFSQMASVQAVQKQEERLGLMSAAAAPPPPPLTEHVNRVLSDDEKSDQSAPVGFRKPPLPLPLQPVQQKACSSYNLPSPDSVASDSSITSANSLSKQHVYYQAPTSPNTKGNVCIQTSQIQIPDSGYSLPPQFDQQQHQQLQYVHASTQFIQHPATTPVPFTSYYQMYAPQSQHHPTDHHQQQYLPPVYLMPVTQAQPYVSTADTTVGASNRSLTPPIPTIITSSTDYKDANIPPIYPPKTCTTAAAKTEMGEGAYRTAITSNLPTLQIPSTQYQQQHVGYAQMQQHLAQSIATGPACYGYDQFHNSKVADHQTYYSQHVQASSTPMPPQYQTMTPADAAIALADASKQLPTDSSKQ